MNYRASGCAFTIACYIPPEFSPLVMEANVESQGPGICGWEITTVIVKGLRKVLPVSDLYRDFVNVIGD